MTTDEVIEAVRPELSHWFSLKLRVDAPTECGNLIERGRVVTYMGHVTGGMILVEHSGVKYVIHPGNTVELA